MAKAQEKAAQDNTTAQPAKKAEGGKKARWYVIQTQSNYEKRVQSLIREQVVLQGREKLVEEVLIPTEQVVEVKKGVKSNAERKFFPGYVLIKCIMTDEVWHLIKSTPHVTSFVGADHGRKPLPISETEAQNILRQMEEGVDKPRSLVSYEIGEEIRVTDGPFNSFQGVVEEVDEEKERLKVSVSIFGRATPIELDFTQVEKS
jgi:transcriptional antiterminator NusG